jgi:hypothetical protein
LAIILFERLDRKTNFVRRAVTFMNKPMFQVSVLTLLLATGVSTGFAQTVSELKDFLSQRAELSQEQIAEIPQGKPFATNVKGRGEAEIYLFGVVYVNAAPESFSKLASNLNRSGQFPGHAAATKFNAPRNSPTLRALDSTMMTCRR